MNACPDTIPETEDDLTSVPQPLLDAMVYPTAVLDHRGVIRRVNAAWTRRAQSDAGRADGGFLGWNYVAVCRGARGAWREGADVVADGLTDLLNGVRTRFVHTYPCPSDGVPAWYQLVAAPICEDGRLRGLLLQHVDVTRAATQDLARLTPRERAILVGIVDGMSNKEIARRDGVSESAVKLHLRGIFHKLGVSNRTQAAMRGERLMLTGAEPLATGSADLPDPAS